MFNLLSRWVAGGGGDELDFDPSAVAMETVSLSPPVVLFPTMASTALSSLSLSVKSGHSAEKQKHGFSSLQICSHHVTSKCLYPSKSPSVFKIVSVVKVTSKYGIGVKCNQSAVTVIVTLMGIFKVTCNQTLKYHCDKSQTSNIRF